MITPGIMAQIRARATELGMNQSDVARVLGVDRRQVSHWWTGNKNPSLPTLERLLAVLDMEVVNTKVGAKP